ncbi:ubiquitin-specific protease doa4 [Mortierella sp. AD094]|nr:ubiquitin-specific protease doa4 [Mortierella sp. AD094]
MLPTTTTPTSTVLDSPQKKIQNLVAASRVEYDPGYGPKKYIRSAHGILNLADTARVRGEMEGAFVNYLKATTVVLEIVPHDKEFDKIKTDPEYVKIKKVKDARMLGYKLTDDFELYRDALQNINSYKFLQRVVDLLPDTEKIKELLLAKYESIQDIEASALATAAKAGRPKPPPRPSKPEFLSSSRYDGQTPIAAMPTQVNSSLSAPITLSAAYPSTVSQPLTFNQNSTPTVALQGSIASMSIASPNNMPVAPTPTSLASYRPLQPTIYGATTPSTSAFQPNVTPLPASAISSEPSISTISANLNPASAALGSGPLPQPFLNSVPMPAFKPPTPTSAVLTNGNTRDIGGSPNATPPLSTSTQSSTSIGCDNTNPYPYPTSIKPQRLLQYMHQSNSLSLLLIDVRMQVQYKDARIKSSTIINIEPPALRDGVSAKIIADQGLFNNPPSERRLFADRANFSLVIYYDQYSTEIPTSGPLCNLVRALHDLEFEKALFRRPVFLIGGFDAWLECAGMNWVEGHGVDAARRIGLPSPPSTDIDDSSSTASQDDLQYRSGSTPIPPNPQASNHAIFAKISRGGGISRQDGRIIRRNLEDFIGRDDGPQSMVNPRIGSNSPNLPNVAYPPRATPFTNRNAASYPSSTYNGASASNTNGGSNVNTAYGGYSLPGQYGDYDQGSTMTSGDISNRSNATPGQLQRRLTIYDDHWNNFGGVERNSQTVTSPPVPEKIPIPGAAMSITSADVNTSTGPSLPTALPASNMRPPIPSKPMRPLPQPPVMNDLKDYTKFGSGFSKIAGSQLGKTGLTNLGNTCFMNSVIQCLIATPPLSRYFLDGSFKRHINIRNPLGTQGRLADAFSDLIRSMWSGQSLVVSPTSFRYAISGFAPQFKGTEQHDSQEFLSFLLDGLHEDLKMEPRLAPPGDEEGSEADEARMEAMPEYEASEIAWSRYLRRDNSIIVNLFQGQFKNRLCCTKCGKTSTTYNAFMYLALPIKAKVSGRQPQTLSSCLNAFVEPEIMDGDNAWNCPHCKKPRKATKQLTISRVPDVLLIQLKRFSSDGPFKNKIKAMVQYPIQDLDLTKYLPKRPSGGPAEPAIFDLYAVSNHSGEVSSGHYTACVRGEAPNSWINFDDSRVSPCDKSVAVSEHGYTLFYVRKK